MQKWVVTREGSHFLPSSQPKTSFCFLLEVIQKSPVTSGGFLPSILLETCCPWQVSLTKGFCFGIKPKEAFLVLLIQWLSWSHVMVVFNPVTTQYQNSKREPTYLDELCSQKSGTVCNVLKTHLWICFQLMTHFNGKRDYTALHIAEHKIQQSIKAPF